MNREEEKEEAAKNYIKNKIWDDSIEECAGCNGFRKGVDWADSHPSLELVEKIISRTFEGWDFLSPVNELAKLIKEEIENE